MVKGWRWGISTKLLICFLAISAMSLVSATIAWVAQRQTQAAVEKMTDTTLPLVLNAHALAKQVSTLTALSQTFVSIRHDRELDQIRRQIQSIQTHLDNRFETLVRQSDSDQPTDAIKANLALIIKNIDEQLELIHIRLFRQKNATSRLDNALKLAQHLQAMVRQQTILTSDTTTTHIEAIRELIIAGDRGQDILDRFNHLTQQELFELETMNALSYRSLKLVELLYQLGEARTLPAIAKLREDFDFNLRAMIRLLVRRRDRRQYPHITTDVRSLSQLTQPEDDLFHLYSSILSSDQQLGESRAQNMRLSSDLRLNVDNLLLAAQQSVKRATQDTNTIIGLALKALLVAGLTSIGLSIALAVGYIYRQVIRRLAYLSNATRELANGNLDIQVREEGHDELTEMAEAVRVFQNNAILLRENEQSLQAQKQTLEQVVKELARSNDDLDQFAYIASHDLKAPLHAIQNLARWITEDASEVLPENSREELALLRQRAQRMSVLLDDLLRYSRIGRVDTPPELVNPHALISDTIGMLDIPESFRVEVDADLPKVAASPVALKLVFRNLIANSIKHHHLSGGRITISGRALEQAVEFSVTDDGPGIDPSFHSRIFQMFQTLKPRDHVEGSGMGLSLVNKTLEVHGGSITIESAVEQGSTFRFTWPQNQVEH